MPMTAIPDPHALTVIRRAYARQILLRAGALGDVTLKDAFAAVPRERFLGSGPWRLAWRGGYRDCPAQADLVYQDALFALAEERGVNNGEPSLHAAWMHAVQPRRGKRALMVGAGAGYYAAILAELVERDGQVLAIEHDPQLAEAARVNLAPWPQAKVEHGDGALWPRGPVDVVYICASCERPAAPWLDRLAVRAAARPRQRKSERAVTGDVVENLLATCWLNRPQDLRDHALILVAFASGGRRRSEVAALRVEDVVAEPDVPADPADPNSARLPCRRLRLGRTKATDADEDASAFLIGAPVRALDAWLQHARITSGPVFRRIDQWENILPEALTGQGVNLILKRRIAMAGLDPQLYSAHGLRSGFLTEAARQGVPLPEAMAQSQHRSVQQAARCYNDAERRMGRAARLLG